MPNIVTPPKAPITIGLVNVNGRDLEVRQHPEFVRFFFDLMRRIGGVSALTTEELTMLLEASALAPAQAAAALSADDLTPAVQASDGAAQASADPHGRMEALEAEVSRLRVLINDIQQGYQL